MKDQAKEPVTAVSGPDPRRLLRTAWVGAVATVAAGSLLCTASAGVPVANVPDHDLDVPSRLHGPVESMPVGQTGTAPDEVRRGHIVTVPERADQGPAPQESRATVDVRGAEEGQDFSLRASLLDVVTMFGGSTLGYANGRIPAAVLCPLVFAPGHMLRCDAAERLTALSEEFEREFGYPIPITDSYRSYVQQIAVARAKPHLAAVPGTSNHGWGLAVDLSDPIAGGASREYMWLRVHGPDHGWDNPSWARPDGAKPEPWHFEFFAAGSVPHRASDPFDVGTWVSAGPSGSTDGASPRDKPAIDPRPKNGPTAGKVRKPPTKPAGGPSSPTPKPTASTTGPAPSPRPSPSPSPSEPGQEPPTPTPTSPSPSPSPSEPGQEPPASPSPSPSEPAPDPIPTPAPSSGDKMPPVPMPSPGPSVSSGPLSGLAKGLGLTDDDAEED